MNVAEEETLRNVPIERQDTNILNIMPRGRHEDTTSRRETMFTGRRPGRTITRLMGLSTDDPWNVISSTDLPVDSLQEVQITTAGISAEDGDAPGAIFNFVTKSGGNEFHGGANLYYQNENTRSEHYRRGAAGRDWQRRRSG